MTEIQKSRNLTYVFISHNLAVVKNICQNMLVMYLGKAMEAGESTAVFANPLHPYTKALLSAILDIDMHRARERILLEGDIPSPIDPPPGCAFHPRCRYAESICREQIPPLRDFGGQHYAACHLAEKLTLQAIVAGESGRGTMKESS